MLATEALGFTGHVAQPDGLLLTELACRARLFGTLGLGTRHA